MGIKSHCVTSSYFLRVKHNVVIAYKFEFQKDQVSVKRFIKVIAKGISQKQNAHLKDT